MQRDSASFRDPSGHVYEAEQAIYRTILLGYADEWTWVKESGLLDSARDKGLISCEEVPRAQWPADAPSDAALLLRSPKLPFISYPYEWCFSQLRDAALLTLDLHMAALEHDCVLKDASAYNVQFQDSKPVFIDLLSFERRREGQPWEAYGQFCRHFLAPLALMSRRDAACGLFSRQWIDGVPLELAASLLPWRSRCSVGLGLHIHAHAAMRRKHGDSRLSAQKVRDMRMGKRKLLDVAQSLRETAAALSPPGTATEWGDYYNDTNYTAAARAAKEKAVRDLAARYSGELAVDLGANTGEFSRLMAPHFSLVLACDVDHDTVEKHWRFLHTQQSQGHVLPLLLDLSSPSPSLGWACKERLSFAQRCRADFVSALALCHHLRFTCGIPLPGIAEFFVSLLREKGVILAEFVPKEDSQAQRLLARRDDIFADYTEEAFVEAFRQQGLIPRESVSLPESCRRLFLFGRDSR